MILESSLITEVKINMKQCEDIRLLLPWLVNGTLQSDDKYQVLSHLSCCSECRRELADVISIYNSVVSEKVSINSAKSDELFTLITSQINKASIEENDEQKIVRDMLQNLGELPLITLVFKPAIDKIHTVFDKNLKETKDAVVSVLNQAKAIGSIYAKLLYVLAAQ